MLVLGVDIGSITTKVVILQNEDVVFERMGKFVAGTDENVLKLLSPFMEERGLASIDEFASIGCTGIGSNEFSLAQVRKSIPACLAAGMSSIYPSVRTVVDVGAESSCVVRINKIGKLKDYVTHDKCASGTGTFLDLISQTLRLSFEDMEEKCLSSEHPVEIGNTCAVFMEQEIISLLHANPPVPLQDIIGGVFTTMAKRIIGMIKVVGLEQDVAACGGVVNNKGFVRMFEKELECGVEVPERVEMIPALGVARIAQRLLSK